MTVQSPFAGQQPPPPPPTQVPAEAQQGQFPVPVSAAPAVNPVAEGPGPGNEHVDEDRGMPQLKLLQALSPECTPGEGNVPGAVPGVFLESRENKLLGTTVYVVNAFFRIRHTVWHENDRGQPKGSFATEVEAKACQAQHPGSDVVYTPEHFVFIMRDGEFAGPYMLVMPKSKLGANRAWNTMIRNQGHSHRYIKWWKLTSSHQASAKGSWYIFGAEEAQPGAGWVSQEHFKEAEEFVKTMTALEAQERAVPVAPGEVLPAT